MEPLIQGLRDSKWQVRREAAKALGKIGDARASEPLTQALKDKEDLVRSEARSALEEIKAKKSWK